MPPRLLVRPGNSASAWGKLPRAAPGTSVARGLRQALGVLPEPATARCPERKKGRDHSPPPRWLGVCPLTASSRRVEGAALVLLLALCSGWVATRAVKMNLHSKEYTERCALTVRLRHEGYHGWQQCRWYGREVQCVVCKEPGSPVVRPLPADPYALPKHRADDAVQHTAAM